MRFPRRTALALGLLPAAALAQGEYPARPVRVIIGFPPGGGVDIVARIIMPRLAERLGGTVLVENRPGANGNIAMEAVARSAPDGYTLFYGNVGNLAVTNALYPNLSFDTLRDFVPIGQTMESVLVIAVADGVAARTLAELIAFARANPGRLNAGSAGAGGPSHLALEGFKRAIGAEITHVPYRGSAPAIQDLAGGRIDMIIDGYSLMRAVVEGGRARVLAVAGERREAILPDVPTTAEAGLPGFTAGSWHGLVAPAGTPPGVIARLEAALAAVMREPGTAEALAQQGVAPRWRDAASFGRFVAEERARWTGVVREAGIRLE
ncbi:MAG TPA: tripartite tricarboxylate transporter substrate binding protein [Acetobacteraceae bacterium]|nr:tripartite tricarboxylate transporter substrate binding protein [Acetobacteraceae bacterium]